jgi:ribosomal protein S4
LLPLLQPVPRFRRLETFEKRVVPLREWPFLLSDPVNKFLERPLKTRLKSRLDVLLVDRGMVPSRERARALIIAGRVLVDEQKVDKP